MANVKARISITIDDAILAKVDEYAKRNGISRAGAISVLITQALEYSEAVSGFGSMSRMLEELNTAAKLKGGLIDD